LTPCRFLIWHRRFKRTCRLHFRVKETRPGTFWRNKGRKYLVHINEMLGIRKYLTHPSSIYKFPIGFSFFVWFYLATFLATHLYNPFSIYSEVIRSPRIKRRHDCLKYWCQQTTYTMSKSRILLFVMMSGIFICFMLEFDCMSFCSNSFLVLWL
jgi:hypothetical protein